MVKRPGAYQKDVQMRKAGAKKLLLDFQTATMENAKTIVSVSF